MVDVGDFELITQVLDTVLGHGLDRQDAGPGTEGLFGRDLVLVGRIGIDVLPLGEVLHVQADDRGRRDEVGGARVLDIHDGAERQVAVRVGGKDIEVVHHGTEGDDGLQVAGNLLLAAVDVENQVLGQAVGVRLGEVEVAPEVVAEGGGTGGFHTGPAGKEVIDVTVHVEVDGVDFVVIDVPDTVAVGVRRDRDGRGVVVGGPAVHVDVVALAGGGIQLVDGFFGLDRHFAAVFCRIEPESVREALAIGEVVRVEVDAPLALDGLGFLEEVVDVADGGITPVEGTADIDGIVGCGAGGKDGLDEDLVVLGRKGGLLVVEQEALLLDAAEGCKGGEADQYGFENLFHIAERLLF